MLISDSQVHIWAANTPERPWAPGTRPHRAEPLGHEALLHAVKLSALPSYTDAPYPYRNLHTHLRRVYDAFGPQRMMWGSDLSRLRGTYRECVTTFTEEMKWLSPKDLEWIMGRTLCEWLGWA